MKDYTGNLNHDFFIYCCLEGIEKARKESDLSEAIRLVNEAERRAYEHLSESEVGLKLVTEKISEFERYLAETFTEENM